MQNEINFEINQKNSLPKSRELILFKEGIANSLKTLNVVQLIVQVISPLVATTTLT
jgi:hypothetical protein